MKQNIFQIERIPLEWTDWYLIYLFLSALKLTQNAIPISHFLSVGMFQNAFSANNNFSFPVDRK